MTVHGYPYPEMTEGPDLRCSIGVRPIVPGV